MKIQPNWLLFTGSLLVVAALYNHYLGHSALLVEIIFVLAGLALGIYSLVVIDKKAPESEGGLVLAFLARFMKKETAVRLLPLVGFVLIASWSAWKIFAIDESNLRMEDFIVTLFGLSLVLYHSGPSRFVMHKDFVVLYLLFLTIVFVVIWKTYSFITGESYARVTAYAEFYFITTPVVALVRLFGVQANADLNLDGIGLSNTIEYEYHDKLLRVGIGTGCSGLYSAGLFFSAFLAFVLVRYKKIDLPIFEALGLGLLVTWGSNIIRMVITILVGSVWGHPALAFVHSYLGILIFIAFLSVFWAVIVRWLDRHEPLMPTEPSTASVTAAQE